MAFSSLKFIFFFALCTGALALTNIRGFKFNSPRARHIILLLFSLVFYAMWDALCCVMLASLCFFVWQVGRLLGRTKKKAHAVIGVLIPLIVLCAFKYAGFFVSSFCAVLGLGDAGALKLILPLGISFYVFQCVAYIIDIYRGRAEPERDFVSFALLIFFFPKIVQGPLVKSSVFLSQLSEDRRVTLEGLSAGVQFFVFGLFKKLVIADNISVFVDAVYSNPAEFHAVTVILAVIAYSVQIYCDFSGYTDMAVGCARCLGYELPANFDLPYLSKNVTEFWRRWHITLSDWLKNYIYIPLGGNRKGPVRTYINLFLTMLIGGLWHGAAWTFVVWGALHGAALCIHKAWMKLRGGKVPGKIRNAVSVLLTFLFVSAAWVFFRADSFDTVGRIFSAIFTWQSGVIFPSFWAVFGICSLIIGEAAAIIRSKKKGTELCGFYPTVDLGTVKGLLIFFVFAGITIGLACTGANPFIYQQF